MANGDDKTGVNPEVISEGPAEPYRVSDVPVATAIRILLDKIQQVKEDLANIELEATEIKRIQEGESHD